MTDSDDTRSFVDTSRYPIADKAGSARINLVDSCRKALSQTGSARLETFINPHTVATMAREVESHAELADSISLYQNPYLADEDESLPTGHPARHFEAWENLTLCRDRLPEDGLIGRLFHNMKLLEFIRDCLGLETLHHYRDPMGGYMVNIIKTGGKIPWHFDTNDFSISILLQTPSEGGIFEFAPNLRNPGTENLEGVSSVLNGDSDNVIKLPAKPGDLLIFKGRNSLHRVNEVMGQTPRYSLIFGYTNNPEIIATASRRMRHFGRCHDAHVEFEASLGN